MGVRFTVITAVLVVLVAILYYLDRTPPPPPRRVGLPAPRTPQPPAPSGTPLVVADPASISRIRIQFDGRERTTQRTETGWTGTDRPELVEEFVRDLTRLGPLETIDVPPEGRAEFGLAPPRGRIELFPTNTTTPIVIEIGNLNPPGTGLYVRRPPEPEVLLIGSLIHWELQRTLGVLHASPTPTPIT
jgi:hypothetical protein